jgi:NAD(P)-dependent dehydrogenase (short-subunit alcohol dehydrogenase family)
MNTAREKAIVVTGASTGIGKASVLALLEAGFRVFAGVRNETAANLLRGEVPPARAGRLATLELDVTNEAQIQSAVGHVERQVGEAGCGASSTMPASPWPGPWSTSRTRSCGGSLKST